MSSASSYSLILRFMHLLWLNYGLNFFFPEALVQGANRSMQNGLLTLSSSMLFHLCITEKLYSSRN